MTPPNPSIAKGSSKSFTAIGTYSDTSTQDLTTAVTWDSATPTVATISNATGSEGVASTGLTTTTGTSVISATLTGVTGSTLLTVTAATLTQIQVTPSNPAIAKGSSVSFIATGIYSDTSTQDVTTAVTWDSATTTVATISNATGSQGVASTGPTTTTGTSVISASLSGITGSTLLKVTAATLVSIGVAPITPTISKGTAQQFSATGTYSDTTTQDLTAAVTWASGTPTVATISNAPGSQGLASTSASTVTGTTTISATLTGITGSTVLTVTSAVLVSIDVAPFNPTMPNGTSLPFTATGTYSDGTTQDLTLAVTWSSTVGTSVSNAASPPKGTVTAQASSGTSIVTATDVATGISGTSTVTLTAVVLTAIVVTPNPASIPNGTSQPFTAQGQYSDGSVVDLTSSVTWTSRNSTALSILVNTGVATAHTNTGTVTITATDPSTSIFGTATVTLTGVTLVRIDVTPADETLSRGTTEDYTATAVYSDFSTADITDSVTWSSSNTAVATISNAALTRGTATTSSTTTGTTTITATDPTTMVSGSTQLVVANITLVSITVTPANATIAKGARIQYVATGHYSDGSTRNLSNVVSWSSSSASVANPGNGRKKKGIVVAKHNGTTTITATTQGISGSTKLTVTTGTLASITVSPTPVTIPKHTKQQFIATGHYTDGSTADITAIVSWTSSSGTWWANISNGPFSYGLASASAAGVTTIKAFDSASNLSATASLTVTNATLVSILLSLPQSPTSRSVWNQQMAATGIVLGQLG